MTLWDFFFSANIVTAVVLTAAHSNCKYLNLFCNIDKWAVNQGLSMCFTGSGMRKICDGYQIQHRHKNWRQRKNVQITESKLW
jgi:hypothetical protein